MRNFESNFTFHEENAPTHKLLYHKCEKKYSAFCFMNNCIQYLSQWFWFPSYRNVGLRVSLRPLVLLVLTRQGTNHTVIIIKLHIYVLNNNNISFLRTRFRHKTMPKDVCNNEFLEVDKVIKSAGCDYSLANPDRDLRRIACQHHILWCVHFTLIW